MGLIKYVGPGRVAIDTAIFIYYIEEHPEYLPLVAPLFAETAAGARELVTSALTLLEVLVVPFRVADLPLADRYEAVLTRSRGLRMVEIDRGQLRTASQIRAAYGIRTPDALQLAAAFATRCATFLTNDRRLPALPGLRIVQLSDVR